MDLISRLKEHSAELTDLNCIMATLQWDQEVMLPQEAGAERAGQLATLSAIIHRREVAAELGDLLELAGRPADGRSDADQALIRVMRRNYEQNTRLPEEFVIEFARLTGRALQAWVEARSNSDFGRFAPILKQIVEMSRQKAEYLGYSEEPYDALLDLHEEGLTTNTVRTVFAGLKEPLSRMVRKAAALPSSSAGFAEDFVQSAQVRFAEHMLESIGFDFSRGRQDRSAHPFSTTLGHHDRRVTNRYHSKSIEFIFSALHEGGHALYELGIDQALAHTCLDNGVSLGIHESQSRLWENIIGRSLPFWQRFFPDLLRAFPVQFKGVSVDNFVSAINTVKPSLIRVEADEVSYNLHVLIRFELEQRLMAGSLTVDELPAAWNALYRDYLGVEVNSDANGVLQDIHWAHGSIGYFPTYTIGNLAAAQIWNTFTSEHPDHAEIIASGRLSVIREWLTSAIYAHGSIYPPGELLRRVTGESLDSSYYLDYLSLKYKELV
ncbi:MAG: hypothetical protein A2511_08270 [Deltaproteobacteria bacterium RIFOXYD12_FULL_50_9]|nr:MAG: hypothetical protein A2511_08270 [Deltaproteobacteria bacterium RIFOXYD12_FULL_50_9]